MRCTGSPTLPRSSAASTKSDEAAAVLPQFCDTVVMASRREAELAKLLENTYRHVNIALVNELALLSHELEIDLWDAIRCAATKPFGFQAFTGPGVGGHCIPIDPNYLSHHVRSRLGHTFRFVELAQDINSAMPGYVCRRVQDLLNENSKAVRGSRIVIVGITYKPNVADSREPVATHRKHSSGHGCRPRTGTHSSTNGQSTERLSPR